MPNYPYRCLNCRKHFEVYLSYAEYGKKAVACPYCKSQEVERIIVKVRVARSEESRLENMMDPTKLSGLEDDPKALGKLMKEMSREMGEEMGPEFEEVVDRLEAGQSPEEIEKSVPDLGAASPEPGLDI